MDWSQLEALAREMGIEELGALWLQRGRLLERLGAFPAADQDKAARHLLREAAREVNRPMRVGDERVRRLKPQDERDVVQKW
jgi:hypothetical protein